jgi:uncharacterized membrane protein
MRAETKMYLSIFFAVVMVYFLTITLSTHSLLGVTLGFVAYHGIQLEYKVNHILKQKGWD